MASQKMLLFDALRINDTGTYFESVAREYKLRMLNSGFPPTTSGSDTADDILMNILRLAIVVKDEIAQAMENHGLKLKLSSDRYIAAEQDAVGKIKSLTGMFESAENEEIPPQSLP